MAGFPLTELPEAGVCFNLESTELRLQKVTFKRSERRTKTNEDSKCINNFIPHQLLYIYHILSIGGEARVCITAVSLQKCCGPFVCSVGSVLCNHNELKEIESNAWRSSECMTMQTSVL